MNYHQAKRKAEQRIRLTGSPYFPIKCLNGSWVVGTWIAKMEKEQLRASYTVRAAPTRDNRGQVKRFK